MSGILRRTIYYDDSDGYIRFFDMAKVDTGIGSMLEPFTTIGLRHGVGTEFNAVDFADDAQRIDKMENFSIDKAQALIGDGLHSAIYMPRTGR